MKFSVLGCLLAAAFSAVHAAPVAPQELADKAAQGYRLLSLAEGAEPVWKTKEEKLELLRAKVHFVSLFSSQLLQHGTDACDIV